MNSSMFLRWQEKSISAGHFGLDELTTFGGS